LDGIAECDPRCGRFYNQEGDYSACPGGEAARYDMSLWLTQGQTNGQGGDWGQRLGAELFLSNLDSWYFFLHEFGHTMGLTDFVDWYPAEPANFIMKGHSSKVITEFDIWMMRNFWRHFQTEDPNRYATPPPADVPAPMPTGVVRA
jgi:hypothetical protein